MSANRKFKPPYTFESDFYDMPWQEQDIYEAEARDWLRENGIDPEDLEAVRTFVDQFRTPPKSREPDSDDDREWNFKPPFMGPFEVDRDFYRLPKSGRIAYMNARMDWIDKQAEGH